MSGKHHWMTKSNIEISWGDVQYGFTLDGDAYQRDVVPLEQVHGSQVIQRNTQNAGLKIEADGHWTDVADVTVGIRTADCVPLLIVLPGTAVAAIHAGWKGVDKQIQINLYEQWQELGYDLSQAVWIVGPHICPACFEVTPPVLDHFETKARTNNVLTIDDKCFVDLTGCLLTDALDKGFPMPSALLTMGGCTVESAHWPSYRRDGAGSGRLYSWVRRVEK